MQIAPDERVARRRGLGDAAVDLRRLDPGRQKGEGSGGLVARLDLQPGPVDGAAVEPRRRAGLEPAHGKAQRLGSSASRGRAPRRPGRPASSPADMDQAAQEGAGGQHHGAAGQDLARRQANPATRPSSIDQQVLDRAGADLQVRLLGQQRLHRPGGRASRSVWARGPRTAGPLLRFSMRNWMPARSIARAISPSRASISRTR